MLTVLSKSMPDYVSLRQFAMRFPHWLHDGIPLLIKVHASSTESVPLRETGCFADHLTQTGRPAAYPPHVRSPTIRSMFMLIYSDHMYAVRSRFTSYAVRSRVAYEVAKAVS